MSHKITSIKIFFIAFSLLFAGMIHAQTLQQRLEKLAKTWPITFHKPVFPAIRSGHFGMEIFNYKTSSGRRS